MNFSKFNKWDSPWINIKFIIGLLIIIIVSMMGIIGSYLWDTSQAKAASTPINLPPYWIQDHPIFLPGTMEHPLGTESNGRDILSVILVGTPRSLEVGFIAAGIGMLIGTVLGFISGFISAPMGIGGAVINVPILRYFGYPINNAIGSAAAIGFIIALFGGLGFFLTGYYLNANLPLSIGFINIPAFLIFIPITMFMARIGANTSNKMDKLILQRLFGIFLYVIGSIFLYRYLNI